MDRVTRGKVVPAQQDRSCTLNVLEVDREDLINEAQQRVESRLDRIAAANRSVTMKNLLKHLGISDQLFTPHNQDFESMLRLNLMRVWAPDEIHRNIRVDEDHRDSSR